MANEEAADACSEPTPDGHLPNWAGVCPHLKERKMISGYKLIQAPVVGRCTGCAFSNKSFGDRFCPEGPCAADAPDGIGVTAIAVPVTAVITKM